MTYITRNQILEIARSREAALTEGRFRTQTKSTAKRSVFLSHCHDEKELVAGAIRLLSSQQVSVYVDWLDSSLPRITSSTTALSLRSRILGSDKFVLLASERALNSKWVPWELGISDPKKNIAILPYRLDGTDWNRSEYMGLYPWIEPTNSTYHSIADNLAGFQVLYPDKPGATRLHDWILS